MEITELKDFQVTLDIKRNGAYRAAFEMRHNDHNPLIIRLKDDGVDVNLNEYGITQATLLVTRKDKQDIALPGTITPEGYGSFTLGGTSLAKEGMVQVVAQFYNADMERISTPTLIFNAIRDPAAGEIHLEEKEVTLVELLLSDAPVIIQEAIDATNAANVKIEEMDEAINTTKLNYKGYVENDAELEALTGMEPSDTWRIAVSASNGNRAATARWDGTDWIITDVQDATIVSTLTKQLDETKRINVFFSNLKAFLKLNGWLNEKSIFNIGDSISHGANAPDIPNDSWFGIMKKFLNLETNSASYGFTSMMFKITNTTDYLEIHTVNMQNYLDWTYTTAGDRYLFPSYTTTVNNTNLDIIVKKPFNFIKIYFEKNADGGQFEVRVNNVLVDTIDYTGNDIHAVTDFIPVSVTGQFTVTLRKISGTGVFAVKGMGYFDSEDDVVPNNFSRSGARLALIPDSTLDKICANDVVFFSLGHNDNGDVTVTHAQFQAKLDYCKNIFVANNTKLIVTDFIYDVDTNPYKQSLKQLADELGGLYVNVMKEVWKSTNATNISGGYTGDSSHPTVLGHQLVAEFIAKLLKLGVSSKFFAQKIGLQDVEISALRTDVDAIDPSGEPWVYLTLQNGFTNLLTSDRYRAKYRKQGNIVHVIIYVQGGTIGQSITQLPVGARPNLGFTQYLRKVGADIWDVTINEDGIITPNGPSSLSQYKFVMTYMIE